MKKKETILCHTFIGTVPLVIGKRFLFEAEGQQLRQMCVVKNCPGIYIGRFWMPSHEVVDCVSGFVIPRSDNISHNASQKEVIQAFLKEMHELAITPDRITSVVKEAKPEDVKWPESKLSALSCEVKQIIKQAYGVCL